MRQIAILAAIGLCLAGCGSGPSRERLAALKSEWATLEAERDAGRISWTTWAKRTHEAARAAAPLNADEQEMMAYRTLLASRVDAKQITPEQFEYEFAATRRIMADREQARNQAAWAAAADGFAAASASLQAANASQPQFAPAPASMFAQPVRCTSYRIGTAVQTNCN